MSEQSPIAPVLSDLEEATLSQLHQAWRHQRQANRVDPGPSPSILGTLALGTLGGGSVGTVLAATASAMLATAPAGHGLLANPIVCGSLAVSAAAGAVVGTAALVWEQRKNRSASLLANEEVARLEQAAATQSPRLSSLLKQRRQKAYDRVDAEASAAAISRNEKTGAVLAGVVLGGLSR